MIATAAERRREEKEEEEEFSRAEVGEMVKGTVSVEWRGNSVELSYCARFSDNKPN